MIKFNEVTWYSKLAAIIFFLGVFPTLTFYIGIQYQEVKDLDQSEENQSLTNQKFRKDDLLGIWVHMYEESKIPFDSDDMEFLISNGVQNYVSHSHNEPAFTGGCLWSLDFDLVNTSCPDEVKFDQFRIIYLDSKTLIIQRGSSSPITFEKH